MDEELLFAQEDESHDARTHGSWKILVVDDEAEVHAITKLALSDFSFDGRSLEFVSAYSGQEAQELIAAHPDAAVIFLDVVMERDDAGLQTVRYIRETLQNHTVRIILRTGQPGQAPEKQVILDYDINDYKTKTELTSQKLFTTLVASLRSYRDIDALNHNKIGLEKIVDATARIFEIQSMECFVEGVLTQMVALLRMDKNALYACGSCFLTNQNRDDLHIVAGIGAYSALKEHSASAVSDQSVQAVIQKAIASKQSVFAADRLAIYFEGVNGSDNLVYMEGHRPIDSRSRQLLEVFCANVAIAFDNILLSAEIEQTQQEVVYRMGAMAETRCKETGNHVRRVAEYSYLLAIKAGLSQEEAWLLKAAAPMHDLGKVGIADAVLNKPSKLTDEEFDEIKRHAFLGYEMLKGSERAILRAAATVAVEHHERYDGTGYPRGLAGEEIHIYGRIVAIADVFDALSFDRVCKSAWPTDEIRALFEKERGRHFDPELTDYFLDNFEEFCAIRERLR